MLRLGIILLALGGMIGCHAVVRGGWNLLWLWPAICLVAVAAGYFRLGAAIYGKRPDGTLPLPRIILLGPWLAYYWVTWTVLRWVSREMKYCELIPGVWIGRRLVGSERPPQIDCVVDLCAELPEPRDIRERVQYLSLPFIDAGVAGLPDVEAALQWLDSSGKNAYIHCAQGHGRTATFAATVLLHRRMAGTAAAALEMVLSARPEARVNGDQRHFLECFERRTSGRVPSIGAGDD